MSALHLPGGKGGRSYSTSESRAESFASLRPVANRQAAFKQRYIKAGKSIAALLALVFASSIERVDFEVVPAPDPNLGNQKSSVNVEFWEAAARQGDFKDYVGGVFIFADAPAIVWLSTNFFERQAHRCLTVGASLDISIREIELEQAADPLFDPFVFARGRHDFQFTVQIVKTRGRAVVAELLIEFEVAFPGKAGDDDARFRFASVWQAVRQGQAPKFRCRGRFDWCWCYHAETVWNDAFYRNKEEM